MRATTLASVLQSFQNARENSVRVRRAAGDDEVDRNNGRHWTNHTVGIAEDSAVLGTISNGNHDFRSRRRIVGALQGIGHVPSDGTRDEQTIGVTWRRHKVKSKSFEIVIRAVESADLEFATVARSGIHLTDMQRTPECPPHFF